MEREQSFNVHQKLNLDEVIETYKDMVFGIALTHVCNKADADDVSQEVFLAYFQKNIVFNGTEHIKAWLIKTTINQCKKRTGSTWRKKTVPLEEVKDVNFIFETEMENTIFIALHQLPYKYRSVLHLFYFEDMTVNEISTVLKVKPGTVKVRLSRGRNLLKEHIASEKSNLLPDKIIL